MKSTIFSANGSSRFLRRNSSNDFGLRLTLSSPPDPNLQLTNPTNCCRNLFREQLRSSPTDIKLQSDRPATVNSSSEDSDPKPSGIPEWRHYSLPPFISVQNSSDMPAFPISIPEQPAGSQRHCPSMKYKCGSTRAKAPTWGV